jgi:hypothetical protein
MDNVALVITVAIACAYCGWFLGYTIGRRKGWVAAQSIYEKSALMRGAIWKREFIITYNSIHPQTPTKAYLTDEEMAVLEELKTVLKGD